MVVLPDEYLSTEKDLPEWEVMYIKAPPHGFLIRKKQDNLLSTRVYPRAVR